MSMSEEEKKQLKIDRYINEKMHSEEKKAFEKAVKKDKELAENLMLSQDMQVFFDNETLEFEKKLETLGQKYFLEKKTNRFLKKKWLLGLSSVLMVTLVIAVFFKKSITTSSIILEEKPIIVKPTFPNLNPNIDDNQKILEEVIETESNENSVPKSQSPIASINPNIYKVNPLLEGILKEQTRNGDVTIIQNVPNYTLKNRVKMPFRINGKTTLKPPYQLIIYSNKLSDFNDDYRILNKKITAKKKSNNKYEITFNANLSLEKGLYYYIIQKETTSELMYINKFSVN